MKLETVDNMSKLDEEVKLHDKFPISSRIIIKRSLRWIVIVVTIHLLVACGLLLINERLFSEDVLTSISAMSASILLLAKGGLLAKMLYEYCYYLLYDYSLVEGHLVVSSGVIERSRGTIPLDLISDCSIQRTLGDLVLGLYSFRISGPSHEVESTKFPQGFLLIEGLLTKDAVELQDLFNSLVRSREAAISHREVKSIVTEYEHRAVS